MPKQLGFQASFEYALRRADAVPLRIGAKKQARINPCLTPAMRPVDETVRGASSRLFLRCVKGAPLSINSWCFIKRQKLETARNSRDVLLPIFIRVNSGGTKLSYSDLLLSIASAQWKQRDAREEITGFVDELNQIGQGFAFNKDFVLKACLVLCDITGIAFKVDNFNAANMLEIERQWPEVREAVWGAVILVDSFGYTGETLTSTNALIPIAYYLRKLGTPATFAQSVVHAEDRTLILKWLVMSLLKRVFSGVPDNVLRPLRNTLAEHYKTGFPLTKIIEAFKGTTRTLMFSKEDIDNLFLYEYSKGYTFSTLALLYPTLDFRNKFHMDHVFPKHSFTLSRLRRAQLSEADAGFGMENYNRLANLQLLEGIPNQEKSGKDFGTWLKETYPGEIARHDFMHKHYIPDIEFSLSNFQSFIREREILLRRAFVELLGRADGSNKEQILEVESK